MADSTKVIEAMMRLSHELTKQYGEDSPLVEIRIKRKTYNYLLMDFCTQNHMIRCEPANLAEPQIYGVTVLPERFGR